MPVIVAVTGLETEEVVTVNVAVEAPEATTTLEGTDADELLDESDTVVLEVAVWDRVTVPVTEFPPSTED